MSSSHAAPAPARRTGSVLLAGFGLAVLALAGMDALPFGTAHDDAGPTPTAGSAPVSIEARPVEAPTHAPRERSFVDESSPSVANLEPELLGALREAAADAAADGVRLTVNSGWRSPEHQAELLRQAAAKYGSAEEAARWVATPEKSEHVSGEAVDIGGANATTWLAKHGDDYGLCQIYRNEPWHFELRAEAVDDGCPSMYADPTQDPRMQ